MSKIQTSHNQFRADRKKLTEILRGNPRFQTTVSIDSVAAVNVSFPPGTVEFTVHGERYRIERNTGEILNMAQARQVELAKIRLMNRQYV